MMRNRISPLSIGLLSILVILIFAPIVVNMLAYGNDYPGHIQSAIVFEDTGRFDRPRPQFLYHIVLIVLNRIFPSQYDAIAASILALLCYLAIGIILLRLFHALFYRMRPRIRLLVPIFFTLMIMLIGPINLLTWPDTNLYFGYITPNSYHNPTVLLLRPFALILFLFAVRIFEADSTPVKTIIAVAIVAALSTIAKPNYGIALIPALGLFTAYALYRKWSINWRLLLAITLPIVAILGWQFIFYQDQGMGGFEFAPLKVASFYAPDNLVLKFLLSMTFPAAVYILYFQKARHNLPLNLAWVTYWIAAFYTYFLAEKKDWVDGNFFWGAEVSLLILFLASLLFFIREHIDAGAERRITPAFSVSAVLLVLHLIGGIAFYLSNLSPQWRDWL